ncbi:MAG: hypothetical protein ABIP41_05190 [Croceibacterium sp.]
MATTLVKKIRRLAAPSSWQVRTRRLFAVTFPLSIPLWLIAVLAGNVLLVVLDIWGPLVRFWSAPPKRISSYNYSDYRSPARPSDTVVELPRPKNKRDAA